MARLKYSSAPWRSCFDCQNGMEKQDLELKKHISIVLSYELLQLYKKMINDFSPDTEIGHSSLETKDC